MKAAIVPEAGQAPVYGDFSEPVPSAGESRVTVTAAALSPVVKAAPPACTTALPGGSPSSPASTAWAGSMTEAGSISFCRKRLMAHGGANRRAFGAVRDAA